MSADKEERGMEALGSVHRPASGDIGWAAAMLRAGHRVRRTAWPYAECLWMVHGDELRFESNYERYPTLGATSILATDWELAESGDAS